MGKIDAVFVFNPIRPDFILNALKSLYKFTPIEFRVVVVDQTKGGLYSDDALWKEFKPLVDAYISPNRNWGFSKSMNEGIIHGIHWGSEYIVAANDDIECLDVRYWSGLMQQFERFPEMLAVNPASPIEQGWGYGIGVPGHECPPWGVIIDGDIWPKKPDGTAITYEECKTKEGYDMLLAHRQGHIEGFAGWFVVGKRKELWENVGLYDERFSPGSGEDYDLLQRVYIAGGRASATLGSFVFHFWGKSKELMASSSPDVLSTNRPGFSSVDELFEYSLDGANSPIYPPRDEHPFGNKRKRKSSGIFIDDPR